jgi:prepilin-type N-terminal cleavage/methylation domain-containing protein
MKRTPASKAGLTLIEVLLAMVILSIGASALLMAMSRSLSVVRTARNREVARNLIARVDVEQPIASVDMDEMYDSGTFDDPAGYTWSRDIQIVDEEQRPGLFLVTTRVSWSEHGSDSYEQTEAFKYAPDAESVTSKP